MMSSSSSSSQHQQQQQQQRRHYFPNQYSHHQNHHRRQEDEQQEMIMPTLPTRNRVVVEHFTTTTSASASAAVEPKSSPSSATTTSPSPHINNMMIIPPPPAMSDEDDNDNDTFDVEENNNNNRNNNDQERRLPPQVLQSISNHHHSKQQKKKQELKFTTNTTTADARTACTTNTTAASSTCCNNSLNDDNNNLTMTYHERIKQYNETMGRRNPSNTVNKNPKTKSGKKAAAVVQQQSQSQSPTKYTEGTRAKTIVPLLALQAYHLPGNNWCQDWKQYMTNNHPIFGICCHHPLHPIGSCTRIVALVAYCIFGLAITNFFWLFLLLNPELNRDIITITFGNDDDQDQTTYVLTTGMVLLWTVGGSIHAVYNLVMWHIAACVCCRTGGCCESIACCPSFGKRLVRVFLFISILLALIVVLLRVGIAQQEEAIIDDEEESIAANNSTTTATTTGQQPSITINNIFDDDTRWDNIDIASSYEAQEFNFLIGYLVEMVLALMVYYPLGGTILFSGILGCGCIPLLGGRPAEVKAEKKKLDQIRQKQQLRSISKNSTDDLDGDDLERNEGIELVFSPQAVREFDERR